jgi:uncharacterized MAPEG superfamily protein
MTTPLMSLLFFALWPIALISIVVAYRVALIVRRRAPPNGFPSDTPHGPEWYRRLLRAHANALETLPTFAVIVFIGAFLGVKTGTFATASVVVAAARVGQSLAHVASGKNRVIRVRFACFAVQMIALCVMVATLLVQ